VKAPRGSQDCNAQLQAQSGFEQLVIATSASFAKKTFDERRGISRRMTTTQKKINLDSVTAQALFKAVTQVTNEINDTMIKDFWKRNNPLKPIAQASEFYVQGIKDAITKTSEGLDTFKDWSDLDLLNNKEGWEELGIAKGTLLSGMYQDTYGNSFPIPQTMAGVEIDTDSDEFQAWYLAFTSFPPSALLESQAKLNEILGRHFEDTNRTGRKKQGPLYAVERWRDIKIVLQNKLTKIKSKLRTNLATEISKPIRSHKQFVHAREAIESTISMIKMTFGLSFQAEDSMIANNFVIAQLDAEEDSEQPFANEQERLAMTRVLHDYKTAYETNGHIDLEKRYLINGDPYSNPRWSLRRMTHFRSYDGSCRNAAEACTSGQGKLYGTQEEARYKARHP